jgi:hypothetical protein
LAGIISFCSLSGVRSQFLACCLVYLLEAKKKTIKTPPFSD